jgi:two-component system sensor histidine kinase VicK
MDLILPEFQLTDVGAIVGAVVEVQRSRAVQNSVGLRLVIAPGLPQIRADNKSLERAIAAVLDNAIKFSPDGGDVLVDVGSADGRLWVKVQDHGVGIPPEKLPRVFDRFFHIDEVGGHLFRGLGLGLSIARQVIEQHGGTIEVASELGKGSTLTVFLKV